MSMLQTVKIKLGGAVDKFKNFIFDASRLDGVFDLKRESGETILSIDADNNLNIPGYIFPGMMQVGNNDSDDNNFVFDATADDGTMLLKRASGQDILSVDETGGVAITNGLQIGSLNGGQLSGLRNKLINGDFSVWQRATNFSISARWTTIYTADRWLLAFDSPTGSLRCDFGQDPGVTAGWPENATYAVLTGTDISTAPDSLGYLLQRIEGVHTLATKRVVLSFNENIFSGSNDSPTKPFFSQNFGSGGSAKVDIQSVSDIKVFDRRIITFDIPNTAGKTIGANSFLQLVFPLAGTFGMAVSGFQLEEGSIATPFENRPIGFELALCQRYFEFVRVYAAGNIISGGALGGTGYYKATKRVLPTVNLESNASGNLAAPNASPGESAILVWGPGAAIGNATLNVLYSIHAEL